VLVRKVDASFFMVESIHAELVLQKRPNNLSLRGSRLQSLSGVQAQQLIRSSMSGMRQMFL